MNMDGRKIYTVSELNAEIKIILEDAYPEIWLEGEISNFKIYNSGHAYFSLKDQDAQISVVMFSGFQKYLKFKLEDGVKIIAKGKVSAYPKRGDYQFIVSYAEPFGKGALQLAFEQLKSKLEKEGLFSSERKRKIPYLPAKIGVVTSPSGAAIRDILTVIDRRFANVEILIYPVKVQGDEAKYEIAEAIEYLNSKYPEIDVMLVGRGGGSYEDLWAFNEELVARAIAASKIPVISCVGHEIDFTIADFVADLRAPTPSAAAEIVVASKTDIELSLNHYRSRLYNRIKNIIGYCEDKIDYFRSARVFKKPQSILEDKIRELDYVMVNLVQKTNRILDQKSAEIGLLSQKLHLLSPLNVLNRGYSISWKADNGEIIKDSQDLKKDDKIRVRFAKGECEARVDVSRI